MGIIKVVKIKNILAVVFLIGLCACSSDNGSTISVEIICNRDIQIGDIVLDIDDSAGSLELRDKYNVYVTSSRTSRTILDGSPIGTLHVQGDNNQLTFETNATVEYACMSGTDNTLLVPSGSGISIDRDTGSGNSIVEY